MALIYKKYFKRLIDVCFSITSLFILSPLFLLVVILIRIDSKGPAFFNQFRIGKDQIRFKLYKFRTMTHKMRDTHYQIFEGDSEVTKIGSFLRRTKIDELPQILNVLLGSMSIVGPRPCLPELKDKFGKFANYRLSVKPGLTSLAAIKGSIYLTWDQKGTYDYIYIKKESLSLDLMILFETIKVVILGEKKIFNSLNTAKNRRNGN